MRVDNEADIVKQLVCRRVNALFARRLVLALPFHRAQVYVHYVLRHSFEIVKAARGYEEAAFVQPAADVAPCSCDKAGFQKLASGVADKLSCDFFFHAYALLNSARQSFSYLPHKDF